jgi:hypothetical protein
MSLCKSNIERLQILGGSTQLGCLVISLEAVLQSVLSQRFGNLVTSKDSLLCIINLLVDISINVVGLAVDFLLLATQFDGTLKRKSGLLSGILEEKTIDWSIVAICVSITELQIVGGISPLGNSFFRLSKVLESP